VCCLVYLLGARRMRLLTGWWVRARSNRRCEQEGCAKAAVDAFRFCKAHGGGKRCTMEGCNKSAQGGGSAHCIMHGGGRRCTEVSLPLVSGECVGAEHFRREVTLSTPVPLWK
jgi:hypothetical protein